MAVRVLIAAGGTAGHVAPALAVADVLRERGCEVVFAGTADRAEGRMVPARGYPLETFRVTGFERRVSPQLARSVGIAALAPAACGRILRRIRPHVVLGGGGYVAGPMVAAAAALRIPTVLTETDGRVGLANRLAGPLARRVLLAVPIAGLEGARYRVVGRPVDPAFFTVTRDEARAAYGIAGDEQVVAVFGGSLGAGRLNTAVTEAYGEEDPAAPLVLHVTGRGKLAGTQPHDRLRVFEYCDSMPQLLHAADLVVCRAGGSVWEVAAAGVPAILVPWSGATGDHQTANSRYFVAGAVVVPDAELDGARLQSEVASLLADEPRRAGLAAAMRDLARPDAASDVADELLKLAGTRAA
jgi:UDP-N-acetylglucosamine--N-acetylmuramyl-(pentapeptide) pyrophosphoryl-undecaprenol N-acetylglucosamine transferase